MANDGQDFDLERFMKLLALLDSPEDGEVRNAVAQLQGLARAHGARIVEVVEYLATPTSGLPQAHEHTVMELDACRAELRELRSMLARLTLQRDTALAMAAKQQRQRKAVSSSRIVKPAVMLCLGLVLLGLGVTHVYFPVKSLDPVIRQRFEDIKEKARKEMDNSAKAFVPTQRRQGR